MRDSDFDSTPLVPASVHMYWCYTCVSFLFVYLGQLVSARLFSVLSVQLKDYTAYRVSTKKQIHRHFCSVLPQLKPGQIPCRVTKRSCSWTKCSIPPKFYRGGKKCKIWPWFSTTFASLRTVLLSKSVCPCAKRMHLDRLRALQCTYEQRTCKNSSWRTSLLRENLAETDLPS